MSEITSVTSTRIKTARICTAIVKSGNRTGEQCGRKAKKGSRLELCGYHQHKPNNDGRKTPKFENPANLRLTIESCRGGFTKASDDIVATLDRHGVVLMWRCLCGEVVLGDTVNLNRRNIFVGLGVSKESGYDQCVKCKSLRCLSCVQKFEDTCFNCTTVKKADTDPSSVEKDETKTVVKPKEESNPLKKTTLTPIKSVLVAELPTKTEEPEMVKPQVKDIKKKNSRASRRVRNHQPKY